MSWHDISSDEPENSYHLFVLGLLVTLSESYAIRSNRESGFGRYDISLVPLDRSSPGFVIEFKKKEATETLEECAERAMEQIIKKSMRPNFRALELRTLTSLPLHSTKKKFCSNR